MGSFKAVLGFVVIAAVIYGSWLVIPPYFANYQFQDEIKNHEAAKALKTSQELEEHQRKLGELDKEEQVL